MKFGDNLKKLRKSAGISQEELAEKVKVSRQSVSKWETGEAYPEMNNILQLCKIFGCNINSLVNDNIEDLESLGEEIKMKVVKFKEEKQKKIKTLSKVVMVISKILKTFTVIGMIGIVIGMLAIGVVGPNVKVKNNQIIAFGQKINYERSDKEIKITGLNKENREETETITEKDKVRAINDTLQFAEENGVTYIVIISEIILLSSEGLLVIAYLILAHIVCLFTNIHDGDTPFTLENVEHIKKLAKLLIIGVVAKFVYATILEAAAEGVFDVHVSLTEIIYILVIYILAYIFEYGYEIQLDSKGKMYGDVNE